jgi:hypothetical protein
MTKTATAAPVIAGQDPRTVGEMFRSRMDEYRESRTRAGITMERAYLMTTPMGQFVIAYVEAEGDANQAMMSIATSDLPLDRDFVAALKRVHGIDLTQPPQGPPPEVIADWTDPAVTTRKRGLGFCAPIVPGGADRGRAFGDEAFKARRAEFEESRRALGESVETVVLLTTPMGDIVCVYLEGDDPVEANRRFAASQTPYDAWFKEQCRTFFVPDVDFDQPLPPIEQVWDYQRAAATV